MHNILDIKNIVGRVEQLENIAENLGQGNPEPILIAPETVRVEYFNSHQWKVVISPDLAGKHRVEVALFGFEGEAISGSGAAKIKGSWYALIEIPREINNIQNGELRINVGTFTLEANEEMFFVVDDVIIPMTLSCMFYLYPES